MRIQTTKRVSATIAGNQVQLVLRIPDMVSAMRLRSGLRQVIDMEQRAGRWASRVDALNARLTRAVGHPAEHDEDGNVTKEAVEPDWDEVKRIEPEAVEASDRLATIQRDLIDLRTDLLGSCQGVIRSILSGGNEVEFGEEGEEKPWSKLDDHERESIVGTFSNDLFGPIFQVLVQGADEDASGKS